MARERVTQPGLDAWGAELMVRLDARFDAMEAAQHRREQERMAYLLKNAEELGGVRSTNQPAHRPARHAGGQARPADRTQPPAAFTPPLPTPADEPCLASHP